VLFRDGEGAQALAACQHEVPTLVARNPNGRLVRLGDVRTDRSVPQQVRDLVEQVLRFVHSLGEEGIGDQTVGSSGAELTVLGAKLLGFD